LPPPHLGSAKQTDDAGWTPGEILRRKERQEKWRNMRSSYMVLYSFISQINDHLYVIIDVIIDDL
jgi:hypothetical protein